MAKSVYQLSRTQIEALRPSGTSTVLGPGQLLVAILNPDIASNDGIANSQIIWAKCTGSKTISSILKLFKRVDGRSVKLFQGRESLKEDRLISSLSAVNDLCMVAAVYEENVASYLKDSVRSSSEQPLRDVTAAAINRGARSQPINSKPSLSPMPLSSTKSPSRSTSTEVVQTCKNKPEPSITKSAIFGNYPTTYPPDPLTLAWTDFVFDRREQTFHDTFREFSFQLDDVDAGIIQEWQSLSPHQRQYFVDRTQKCRFPDIKDHRSFWLFYYDILAEESRTGLRPHSNFETTNAFFLKVHDRWIAMNLKPGGREPFFVKMALKGCTLKVPTVPSGSTLPVSKMVHSQASRSTSLSSELRSMPSSESPSYSPGTDEAHSRIDPVKAEILEVSKPSVEPIRMDTVIPARLNVSEMFQGQSVEQLEKGVAAGAEILRSIRTKIDSEPSEESKHWLQLIGNLEKQVVRTKTIVGVVGATGAGKSSVINAILDQERLVPTNCMRACTAVVTEISYNHEDVPYRAEIDFIRREDWHKELKTSFDDLFDGSGKVSRECANEDSEAGIAYAKIKAVYPLMTKENMEKAAIDDLMNHANVRDLFGRSRSIKEEDPLQFYKQLQRYVDSKEKAVSREKKTEAEKAKAKQMEFWPLIRVVRLYVKAPALATGAVIVDLPGVHDSNQARAAVAQGYLKECTGLWIVAPITRAVDDKSAKTLLGDTFKRQLKMDGGYNSVTFICSKTDDISITEAQDSLNLDDEMAPLYTRSEKLREKAQKLKSELEELKATRSDIAAAMDSADEQLDLWESLKSDLDEGKTVYAPRTNTDDKKRKRTSDDENPRKKSKYYESDDSASDVSDESNGYETDQDVGDEFTPTCEKREPLTAEDIDNKIAEFKACKKDGRQERTRLEQSTKETRAKIAETQQEQDEIDGELSGKCIRGRNEYSRGAIQQDFASGIRELDQEIAEEEDAANFNPEVDVRDYDAVAKSLPVFCVSSRGYQKLMGRLKKDKSLSSFRNIEETEIPALQDHCKKLTVQNREVACKRFLNNFSQLLNSLRLWSSSDGTAANLTDEQQIREAALLDAKMRKLDKALENAVTKVCKDIKTEIEDSLYDKFPQALKAGKAEANDIQMRWGSPINHDNRPQGGLYWSTYKATVRRDGVWSDHNFNQKLIEPVLKQVTPGWEKVFSRRLPQTLSGLANDVFRTLTTFHDDVEKRGISNGLSIATFQMLKQQLPTYKEIAKDAANIVRDFINTQQKDINRAFEPVIVTAMVPIYMRCTAEVGPGQYKRMKAAMEIHVNDVKHSMYDDSVSHVQKLLEKMLKEAADMLLMRLDEVFMAIKRDYGSVIVPKSRNATDSHILPKQQRKIRQDVLEIVENVEQTMNHVLHPEQGPDESTKESSEEISASIESPEKNAESDHVNIKAEEDEEEEEDSNASEPLSKETSEASKTSPDPSLSSKQEDSDMDVTP